MKRLAQCVLLAAASMLAMPVQADAIDVTRALAPDANVKVINVAGEINVTVWDLPEVRVTGRLGRDQTLDILESPSGIQFEVSNRDEDDDDYDEAELDLRVPSGVSMIVEAISADVTIDGTAGESVVVESVSGDVDVNAMVTRVELTSVSGDIEFAGLAERGFFESVSGDISASGVSGEVSVSTVSGDTDLAAAVLERGRFETVSGTLRLRLALGAGGRLTAEAMSGDVRLKLPADQEGEFDLQTFSGDIRSAVGAVENASHGAGSRLRHIQGTSGAQFRIESFSGDIDISRQ